MNKWKSSNEVVLSDSEDLENEEIVNSYSAIKFICSKAQNSKLSNKFWTDPKIVLAIETIKKDLPFNNNQIILFSILSACTLCHNILSIGDLGNKLDVSPFVMFELEKDLADIVKLGYVIKKSDWTDIDGYSVSVEVLAALRDGKKPAEPETIKKKNNVELISYLDEKVIEGNSSLEAVGLELASIRKFNIHLEIVQQFEKLGYNTLEICILIHLLNVAIKFSSNVSFNDMLDFVAQKDSSSAFELKSYLRNKESLLLKTKFIQISKRNFLQDDEIHITRKALAQLLPSEHKMIILRKPNNEELSACTLIKPKDIIKKTMIYDTNTENQLSILRDIVSNKGLKNLQKNLVNEGLKKGVCVLLYGCPGTGKTETVLQFCKENGRNLLQVNISDMKSVWFGKSEKIVSGLFNQYADLIKTSRKMPILLFNEADGVLSKRRNLNENSSCVQTENAIQNIILQEFENNKGIIICTTNMINNLDPAFNRRFLYKIKFSEPDLPTRSALVKLKLGKYITDEQAQEIASSYQLTGGTLDNVLTKIIAKKCLYDAVPSFDEIEEYCSQDIMKSERVPIGFNRSSV